MSVSDLSVVTNQVQKFWSPMFMEELRASLLIGSLVNKEYDGEIKQGGDTVYVSQLNAPTGELRTVGTDADAFGTDQLSMSRISISANKRAVGAYEFTDLAQLQSQLGDKDSTIRQALVYAVSKKINDYLYSKCAPSASAPDHLLNSVANLDATALLTMRKLAAIAKWEKSKGWWLLCDPVYMNDLLGAQTMTSRDYVEGEQPVVAGQIANKRFGFNILEDNGLSTSQALAFHPDFLHLVMQKQIQFKISDLHNQKKFGYVISADLIFGAELGVAGANKHIISTASASATGMVTA
jgi:hypothetical protein